MKVVINACYGGFGLSEKAQAEYIKAHALSDAEYLDVYSIERNDPILLERVERLGDDSFGNFAELEIIEIPDDVEWYIEDYDGFEHVAEQHRTWG